MTNTYSEISLTNIEFDTFSEIQRWQKKELMILILDALLNLGENFDPPPFNSLNPMKFEN